MHRVADHVDLISIWLQYIRVRGESGGVLWAAYGLSLEASWSRS